MRFIKKHELAGIGFILLFIIAVSYISYLAALRRGRDEQRIRDLDTIVVLVNQFNKDFGYYPPSLGTGKIVACGENNVPPSEAKLPVKKNRYQIMSEYAEECRWGTDSPANWGDRVNTIYEGVIPQDPLIDSGRQYVYYSNGEEFQVYTSMESQVKDIYDIGLEPEGIMCGDSVCVYGKASPKTPLDNLINEYQNEGEGE
jgi:hypothetical protein